MRIVGLFRKQWQAAEMVNCQDNHKNCYQGPATTGLLLHTKTESQRLESYQGPAITGLLLHTTTESQSKSWSPFKDLQQQDFYCTQQQNHKSWSPIKDLQQQDSYCTQQENHKSWSPMKDLQQQDLYCIQKQNHKSWSPIKELQQRGFYCKQQTLKAPTHPWVSALSLDTDTSSEIRWALSDMRVCVCWIWWVSSSCWAAKICLSAAVSAGLLGGKHLENTGDRSVL